MLSLEESDELDSELLDDPDIAKFTSGAISGTTNLSTSLNPWLDSSAETSSLITGSIAVVVAAAIDGNDADTVVVAAVVTEAVVVDEVR